MARVHLLALLVYLLTYHISATLANGLVCPTVLPSRCHCFASGESELRVHCASNGTASAAFELTLRPEELVRVQCRGSPSWPQLSLLSALTAGIGRLVVASCPPPGSLLRQLHFGDLQYLKYEDLKGERGLGAGDLDAFPGLKYLVLSNNRLDEVNADLLKDLPKLKQLELRNTSIRIPTGFFNGASSLKTLELSGNKLRDLAPGTFDGLRRIELLNLWRNEFHELQPGVFRGLGSLVSLDLHQNSLTTLPANVFADLRNLEVVNLGGNSFSQLPADLFRTTPKLKIVKLLYNRRNLTELPSGLLADLAELRIVSFMRTGLHRLPEDLLRGAGSLVELNLGRNYLTALPADLLKDATELHTLSLVFNKLSRLPDGLFMNTRKLVKLDLSRNHLTSIGQHTLIGLDSLQEINMENNDLTFIHVDAFNSLEELKVARFANNKLTLRTNLFDVFGHISPFHPCKSLEELYLAHNNITEMYSDWVISSVRLRELDLSYNSFNFLETEDLQFMSTGPVNVDLRYNSIGQVNLARLEYISADHDGSSPPRNSSQSLTVQLGFNPIECDCELYSLLRYLNGEMQPRALGYARLELGDLACAGPKHMRGLRLTELGPASQLRCLVESERPRAGDPCAPGAVCDCWLRPGDKTLLLDCMARNLTRPPVWIDARGVDAIELNLAANELTQSPNMSARGYEKVRSLNLADNRIADLDESLISSNLQTLNLDGNNLTFIDTSVLQKLSNSSRLSRLTLRDNPWRCDCTSRDLHSFIHTNFLDIPDLLNITCAGSNISLSNLTLDELCPASNRLVVLLCSLVSLFGILLGCVAGLYFRFQRQIKVWLYSKSLCLCLVTENELDRDKTYDAFISYSHKDEEFVVKQLVTQLEEGPRPYRLCIHLRDWLAGGWIPMQIARSVEESRRTIIVLSPNFIESLWARLEFQTAYKQALSEGRARVIVVLYGEVGPTDNLDPELRAYLQMNTYVKWGDPWFWQKLRYAMPHSTVDQLPVQIDQKKNENLEIVSKAIAEKKMEEVKIMLVNQNEKNFVITKSVRDISRNFDECCDTQDKWCLTV